MRNLRSGFGRVGYAVLRGSIPVFMAILSAGPVLAAEETIQQAPPGAVAAATNNTIEARLAKYKDMSLEELQTEEQAIEKNILAYAENAQKMQNDLREARLAARENDAVKAIEAKIAALRAEIEATIDSLPDIKPKMDAMSAEKKALFDEMQVRTRLGGLISRAAREAEQAAPAAKNP